MTQVATPAQSPEDQVLETSGDFAGMWAILRFGKGVQWQLIGSLLLVVASSACVMTAARVLGELVEGLVKGGTGPYPLWMLGLIFMALECVSVGLQYFGRLGLAHSTIEITYKVRRELFLKLSRLPIAYFDYQPLGRTLTRLTSDVEGIENFFSGTLARIVIALIHIVMVLGAMLVTDFEFGLVIVAASLPALIFSVALRKPVRHWLRTYRRRNAHLNARLAEFLNGMPVIKAFGLETWTHQKFQEGAQSQLDAALKMMHWNSFIRPATVFLCSLPTLLILWWGGEKVLEGAMSLGILVAFVRYSERFISPIRTISQEIQQIQEALVSSERVRKMLVEPEEAVTLGDDGTVDQPIRGEIVFEDVWMEYTPDRPVLKGVSFKIEPGMTVGLVGATGSGKTTTVNLIPRLYPVKRGRVAIDGISVDDWRREAIRRQLGYVSQDVVVFAGTVRENLTAALPEGRKATDEEIRQACRRTGLDVVLRHFPDGLDHRIIESGDNLSMGEKQLIAFTRMLLKDPAVLILDEATANIDERCEALIQKAMAEVMTGRTCFVIAHRLSTILQCDLILVFKDGRIVEQGTHAELMARGGHYASLAARQLSQA